MLNDPKRNHFRKIICGSNQGTHQLHSFVRYRFGDKSRNAADPLRSDFNTALVSSILPLRSSFRAAGKLSSDFDGIYQPGYSADDFSLRHHILIGQPAGDCTGRDLCPSSHSYYSMHKIIDTGYSVSLDISDNLDSLRNCILPHLQISDGKGKKVSP